MHCSQSRLLDCKNSEIQKMPSATTAYQLSLGPLSHQHPRRRAPEVGLCQEPPPSSSDRHFWQLSLLLASINSPLKGRRRHHGSSGDVPIRGYISPKPLQNIASPLVVAQSSPHRLRLFHLFALTNPKDPERVEIVKL